MNHHRQETVRSIALSLSLLVEALAAMLCVSFGSSLTLSHELLLAADILRTALIPARDDIGKLAAICAICTILNYLLEKE